VLERSPYDTRAASMSRSRVHEIFHAVELQNAAGRHILPLHIIESSPDESTTYLARMAFSGDATDIREGLARLRSLLRSW
jgi:hypothetical protein